MKTICYLKLVAVKGIVIDGSIKQTVEITKSKQTFDCLIISINEDIKIELRESDLKEALSVMAALEPSEE